MDYLPNNATIDEACEWLQHKTGQKWTLPRLLEDGHLRPYVWLDCIEGYPQISGSNREGHLTEMVYHGDVMRLAADRNDALLTMFTAHDGTLVTPNPAWRVELKNIRFKKKALQRVAEIINMQKTAPAQSAATPAPPTQTTKRRTWWDVSSPYIVETMRAGQYATAKELYNALEAKAGSGSPFDKGTGNNRFSLFIRELATPLSLKTMQNKWPEMLKAAARK